MTFSSYKEQLLQGDGLSCYTLHQYKSFLCILPTFIFIFHIHKHWIQPDPGGSNFHSNVRLWLSTGPITKGTHKGLQDTSSAVQLWQTRQSCRGGRTDGAVEPTLQRSKCHQGVKMSWSQERRQPHATASSASCLRPPNWAQALAAQVWEKCTDPRGEPSNKPPSPQSSMNYTGEEKEVILQIAQSVAIPSPWPLVLCFITHNINASQSHLQQSKSKVLSVSPEMSYFFLTEVYW